MSTEAVDDVTNPRGPTGPRTESGKERSSRNATKSGLFSAHDFVHGDEADEYTQARASLMEQLSPEGFLEETFASEIMTAAWRLRRCRLLERDPNPDEQKSVDRARAQSHNILRRSIAEMRKLQTERALRLQPGGQHLLPGLTDSKQLVSTLKLHQKQRLDSRKANGLDSLEGLLAKADHDLGMVTTQTGPASSFCNPTPPASEGQKLTPRNALCPCGSGTKYKRCCGTGASPVLHMAA